MVTLLSEGAYNRSLRAVCTYSPRSLCFQKVHITDPCMLSVPTLRGHSAFRRCIRQIPACCLYLLSSVTLLSEGAYNRSLRAVCTYSPRSLFFQKVHITDPCVLSVPTLRGHSSFRRCIRQIPACCLYLLSSVTLLSEGAYNRSLRAVCTYSPRSLCFQKVHITDPCVLSVPTLLGHSSFRRCI